MQYLFYIISINHYTIRYWLVFEKSRILCYNWIIKFKNCQRKDVKNAWKNSWDICPLNFRQQNSLFRCFVVNNRLVYCFLLCWIFNEEQRQLTETKAIPSCCNATAFNYWIEKIDFWLIYCGRTESSAPTLNILQTL